MSVIKMSSDYDPKQEIMGKVQKYIDEITLTGAQVLLGIYKRPEKTAGGIYLSDQARDEDIYQGKAALILKMGPLAFDKEDDNFFGGKFPQVGDWVMFRPSHGFPVQFGDKLDCRLLEDRRHIKAFLGSPDLVW